MLQESGTQKEHRDQVKGHKGFKMVLIRLEEEIGRTCPHEVFSKEWVEDKCKTSTGISPRKIEIKGPKEALVFFNEQVAIREVWQSSETMPAGDANQ